MVHIVNAAAKRRPPRAKPRQPAKDVGVNPRPLQRRDGRLALGGGGRVKISLDDLMGIVKFCRVGLDKVIAKFGAVHVDERLRGIRVESERAGTGLLFPSAGTPGSGIWAVVVFARIAMIIKIDRKGLHETGKRFIVGGSLVQAAL